jgi:uncharacterized membrane protein
MVYCTKCGAAMQDSDRFCPTCGQAVPGVGAGTGGQAGARTQSFNDLSPKLASTLCYVPFIGWLMSIVILSTPRLKRDKATLFHCFQGLYLFMTFLVVQAVVEPVLDRVNLDFVPNLMTLAIFVAWIYGLVQVANGREVVLPLVGEWASRSANEGV